MSTFNYNELFFPVQKKPGETEPKTREDREFESFYQDMRAYSGITNYIQSTYQKAKKDEEEKTPLKEQAKQFETRFKDRNITDSDLVASEEEVQNRLLRGQGPILFRNYQDGSLIFNHPSQNEMQWQIGRDRSTRSGILAPEKTTWGQLAQRMLAKDLVDEAFFVKYKNEQVFSSPETRKQIVPILEKMAKYGEYGAGASWAQYAPTVDPEDRYNAFEETLSATILPGYKAIYEFGRNYFGSDPVDVTQSVDKPIGWDPIKAWAIYSKEYPETAAWFETNGMNPQEYLLNARDDFHFFEKLGDFIDNNAFRRTTEHDIQLMGGAEYAWKTTVLPLIRDSFASSDAPIDLAVTALLSSVSFGGAGVGYLSARGSLAVGKLGISANNASKLIKGATALKRISDSTIHWLPHNIPAKFLWAPGKSLSNRVGHYTASAVSVGVVTGAWYNIVNQIQNSNSDSSFKFSTANLYHDVLMEIVGEIGLGGLGLGVSKTVNLAATKAFNVNKLSIKFLDTLPPTLKNTLIASAALLHPQKNLADMSKYELEKHTDAVMLWYQLKSANLLGKDGKQNNILSVGAWGIASGFLGPQDTKLVVDKANREFDSKKDELNLTEDDRDLFVSQMLVNSLASRGIDIGGVAEALNKLRLEKFLAGKLQELQEVNKENETQRDSQVSSLVNRLNDLNEEASKIDPNDSDSIDSINEQIEELNIQLEELQSQSFEANVGSLFENADEQSKAYEEFRLKSEERVKELLKLLNGENVVNSNLELVNDEDVSNVSREDLDEVQDAIENSDIPDNGLPLDTNDQLANQLENAAKLVERAPATPEGEATSAQRNELEEDLAKLERQPQQPQTPAQNTASGIVQGFNALAGGVSIAAATKNATDINRVLAGELTIDEMITDQGLDPNKQTAQDLKAVYNLAQQQGLTSITPDLYISLLAESKGQTTQTQVTPSEPQVTPSEPQVTPSEPQQTTSVDIVNNLKDVDEAKALNNILNQFKEDCN
jgi:hypothetical protein